VDIPVWRYGFQGQDGETRARAFGIGDVAAASYAYVITVHKAQGSQWPRVLVIDESHVFDRMQGTGQRWLYTAVTRASEQVVITGTGIVREG
jgi:exodeoxyribonuclease-5